MESIKYNMATYYKTDGTKEQIEPADGKAFTLEEMQKLVDGHIEMIQLPSGKTMVLNEEGRINDLPVNESATRVWQSEFPIERYAGNNLAYMEGVNGNILVATPKEVGDEEDGD